MADNEQKALQLMAEAEKKHNSSKGFFGWLFGRSSKLDEAVDCYQRAANMFKMAKKWDQAGNAFFEAGDLNSKSGNRHDAATNFVDAANCYKKSDPDRAIESFLRAIEIYSDMGRFTMAAKHHQSIAELYETEYMDLDHALSHYEQAADYFKGEESNSSANKCLLKVAHFAAQLGDYDKAIKIYEEVASTSLSSSLLKYRVKEYFFRAALCHLCVDILNAQHALEHYRKIYPGFQDSREWKLVKFADFVGDDKDV